MFHEVAGPIIYKKKRLSLNSLLQRMQNGKPKLPIPFKQCSRQKI